MFAMKMMFAAHLMFVIMISVLKMTHVAEIHAQPMNVRKTIFVQLIPAKEINAPMGTPAEQIRVIMIHALKITFVNHQTCALMPTMIHND